MKYPNNIKKNSNIKISHSNRGMDLENALNQSNNFYLETDRALIYKKPTPIGVVDVSYHHNKKIIEKAYFKQQSTLDYNGLYRGKYIDYEAKETKNKTAFPLKNIHPHQINHIRKVIKHDGIVFLIIKINDETYLLRGDTFINFIDSEERKSIPYSFIQENACFIKEEYYPSLDYLKVVDEIYFKGE